MANLAMVNGPTARLGNSTAHDLAEITLVLRVERDDAGFSRADHDLARVEDALACFLLEAFDD